jgi:hypothetical protein
MDADRQTLAAVFASRCQLAKKSEEEAAAEAVLELRKTTAWVKSNSTKEGSFLWFADEFDLDPSAVRRAIAEKRK